MIFLMAIAVNPWIFIALVFLNSFFEQAGSPVYTGIMKEVYPDGFTDRAMGLRGIVASFLGVGIMSLVGIRTALLISFMITLSAFFLMKWKHPLLQTNLTNSLASRIRALKADPTSYVPTSPLTEESNELFHPRGKSKRLSGDL